MNLLKSKFRRTTAVVAGSVLGLAAAAVFAAPASATGTSASGTATCVTADSWKIDWSVGNSRTTPATVDKVEVTDQDAHSLTVTGGDLAQGAEIAPSAQAHGSTTITDAAVAKATISVTLSWEDDSTETATAEVSKPEACVTPEPSDSETPAPGDSEAPQPGDSDSPAPSESTPTQEPLPLPSDMPGDLGEPTPIVEFYCDAMVFGLDNPADGIEWRLRLETSDGEERDLAIKPGEAKTEMFPAATGFVLTVWPSIVDDGEIVPLEDEDGPVRLDLAWEEPEGCDTGGGGGLPVTGAAAGGIAGGAAALLAIGAVLFVLARRRKLKFTA